MIKLLKGSIPYRFLSEFIKEELETIKMRILDPKIDEELEINTLYTAPLENKLKMMN